MKVTILKPTGYCSGVNHAISLALVAKKEHPDQPVFVYGMLVHNSFVIAFLKENGIETVFDINEISPDSVVVFTAHGHEKKLDQIALDKHLIVYDAICPLVKTNLLLIEQEEHQGHDIIYIGYPSHPESTAAISYSSFIYLYDISHGDFDFSLIHDSSPLVINQTTLNFLSLEKIHQTIKEKIPSARFANEICRATRDRQEAVINLNDDVDAIVVVGDPKSSNTKRLFEIAKTSHPQIFSCLVEDAKQLPLSDLSNKKHIAISSGASTPKAIIDVISETLQNIK